MVDALEDAGIPPSAPRADAAIIEASKIFSKNLMAKYHIPNRKSIKPLRARPCSGLH